MYLSRTMGPIEHYARATAKSQSRVDRPVHTTGAAAFQDRLQRAEAADTLFLAEAQWLDTTNASLFLVRGERRRPEVPKLDAPLSFIKRATDKLDLSRLS